MTRDGDLAGLTSTLQAVQAKLDELAAVVASFDPDHVGRTRALAEDGLARADHALAVAGDALARAESSGADALARADHAAALAGDAMARAESRGADAEARADHALARAGDAVALSESAAADSLARADHAAALARDALARVESLGADALARADHAKDVAGDAVARAESLGADALARAGHAEEVAGDAVARAESLGADALARADHAKELAGDAVARAEALGADAVARAGALGSDAVARAESLGADALARADHAEAVANDAVARADAAAEAGAHAVRASEHAVQVARETMLHARIAALAGWLELRPPAEQLTVSIVLPTRDRPALLPRALQSVLAQRYRRWQLVVVDDGETDAVAAALADVDDERVTVVEGPRRGLGAARNAGLERAAGEVVCYLDDDNVMHPAWLQAVAHVFSTREDVDVAYGVSIAERRAAGPVDQGGEWPFHWQLPWSRETLLRENLTDAGALAHRRELPEARFDEAMGEDWDLLIRLTADKPALAVPAVSHAYATGSGDHMSKSAEHRRALEEVRRRHAGG